MYSEISFPGLGIGKFTLHRTAFSLFGIDVSWYGIIIVAGIIAGFFYFSHRMKELDASSDDILDLSIYTLIFAVIGARLMYVLTNLSEFDNMLDAIAIWNGGIAIYGAIIAGGLTAYIVCRKKKLKFLRVFDCLAPAVMLGQTIGRWGNFINGEAYGSVEFIEFFNRKFSTPWAAKLPWRMELTDFSSSGAVRESGIFQPTFLYESLWNLIGFLIINACFKKRKFRGQIFAMYITWYGIGRFFIEGMRTDSLRFSAVAPLAGFKVSQIIAVLCIIVGVIMLLHGFSKAKKHHHSTDLPLLGSVQKEISTREPLSEHTQVLDAPKDNDTLILGSYEYEHNTQNDKKEEDNTEDEKDDGKDN